MKTLVDKIYQNYASAAPSRFRSFWHECLRSRRLARLIFGMKRFPVDTDDSCYFDLTTILLRHELKKLMRRWENPRMLEIGTGSFAILSGCLSKNISTAIDGVDNREERVECAKNFISANSYKVNAVTSNVFSNVPEKTYDIIFWNLSYYEDPGVLDVLFDQASDYLAPNGVLAVGYNGKALPRATVLSHLESTKKVSLDKAIAYFWNMHEILLIQRTSANRKPDLSFQ